MARPALIDSALKAFSRKETAPKVDPDLALLTNLAGAPEFGPLVEHFRKIRDRAMVKANVAFRKEKSLEAAFHSGQHQAHIDTVMWLLQYSPHNEKE